MVAECGLKKAAKAMGKETKLKKPESKVTLMELGDLSFGVESKELEARASSMHLGAPKSGPIVVRRLSR